MGHQNHQGEISLKELILALVHNWKIIIGCTLIFTLGMLIYLFGFAKSVYQSEVEGIANMHNVSTKYGTYEFPSENPMIYLSAAKNHDVLVEVMKTFNIEGTVEGFRKQISIQNEEDSGKFVIQMKAEKPETAKAMLELTAELTLDSLEKTYRAIAIENFINNSELLILQNQDEKILQKNRLEAMENELTLVQPTITLKKLAVDDPAYLSLIAKERAVNIDSLTEAALLEEVVNPHYLSLEGSIIEIRKSLQEIEINLEKNERYLRELKEKEKIINNYTLNTDNVDYESMDIQVFTNQLLLSNQASFPESRVSPRRGLSLVITVVLGFVLGMFLAFFKAYWYEERYLHK